MKNQNLAKNLVAVGLALAVIPSFLAGALEEQGGGVAGGIVTMLMMGGVFVYVGGLCLVARNKGRSWAWGLTGLCCVVGGITVLFLKPRQVS